MTRERFEQIQREFRLTTMRELSYGGGDATLLLWGETITALKEAQIERDAYKQDCVELRQEVKIREAETEAAEEEVKRLQAKLVELEALYSKEIIVRYPY